MTSRRYRALLIGNSHYPDDADSLPDLKGPINDVSALGRVLSQEWNSLFSPADVKLLTDRQSYEISAELEELLTTARRDDVLLIYYSGHGITADNGSLLLCARNSRTDRRLTTTVSAETITRMTDQSAAAITIIILDCCYAGAFKTGDVATELAGRGRYVLAATRSRDRARDADHGTGFSCFTGHLLRGLQGAAAQPGSSYVTVSDLYQYLCSSMAKDGPFVPQRRFDGDGDPALARTSTRTAQGDAPSVFERREAHVPARTSGHPPQLRRRRLTVFTAAVLTVAGVAAVAAAARDMTGLADSSHQSSTPRTGSQASAIPLIPSSSAGSAHPSSATQPANPPTPTQPTRAQPTSAQPTFITPKSQPISTPKDLSYRLGATSVDSHTVTVTAKASGEPEPRLSYWFFVEVNWGNGNIDYYPRRKMTGRATSFDVTIPSNADPSYVRQGRIYGLNSAENAQAEDKLTRQGETGTDDYFDEATGQSVSNVAKLPY
jgi:Caspase domain